MIKYEIAALEYLSKLSEGGMRDAITLLDKCIAYSPDLTLENVVKALGVLDYDEMFTFLRGLVETRYISDIIGFVEKVHQSGRDLKQFMKQFTNFVLDVIKYRFTQSFATISIPEIYYDAMKPLITNRNLDELLSVLVTLNAEIKWDETPKATIEATFILYLSKEK